MKRIISLVLVIMFAFCLVSCKNGKTGKTNSADVSYYAKLGQIPECKYKLGDSGKKIEKELDKKATEANNSDETYFEVIDKGDTKKIITSDVHYIYDTEKGKVFEVVNFGDAYGFKLGTDEKSVIDAQNKYKLKGEEVSLSEDEIRNVSGNNECVYLEYEFDENTVIFAFENNCLFATIIKTNKK